MRPYSVTALIRAGIDPDAAHAIARALYAVADVDPRAAERRAAEIYAQLKQGGRRQQKVLKPDETNPNVCGRAKWWGGAAVEYDRSAAVSVRFQEWTREWAEAVLRVLKPGAHAVVCASPRMGHRVTCGLEDAGFEIRDSLLWLYGSGFPKC